MIHRGLAIASSEEDVQIFGIAPDSGVVLERLGAADEKWDT